MNSPKLSSMSHRERAQSLTMVGAARPPTPFEVYCLGFRLAMTIDTTV
jgi:hypothetical protein